MLRIKKIASKKSALSLPETTSAALLAALAFFSEASLAARIESCSSDKKQCIVSSTELITGDRVGFFSGDNRLVAWGKVNRMAGPRRTVQIQTAYSSIDGDERVALLTNVTDPATIEEMYTVQRNKNRNIVEASLGTASYAIGPGASGYEVSGAWIMRSWMDIELVGRGMFTSLQGEVSRSVVTRDYLGKENLGVDVQPVAANIVGGLAGIGYTLFAANTVSFRPEIAAGFGYVAGVIGEEDMTAESGFQNRMNNGFGTAVRGNVQAILNLSNWHLGVGLGQTRIHDAFASTVGFSVGMSL